MKIIYTILFVKLKKISKQTGSLSVGGRITLTQNFLIQGKYHCRTLSTPSVSVSDGEFLDELSDIQRFNKDCVPRR
jgi:hypothetical protein